MQDIIKGYPIPKVGHYKVCARSMTYNQSAYIEDCLNGVAMQQTDFPFVHYVIDDCSTDGEQDVIKAWMDRECDMVHAEYYDNDICTITLVNNKINPNCTLVVYFLKKNMYGNPKKRELHKLWSDVCPYIALCEGDDYWTDPYKLQKQVDWLDVNKHYTAIASNTQNITHDGKNIALFSYKPSRDLIDMGEIIRERQFHTAAIIYRKSAMVSSPAKESKTSWDTYLWCCLMSQGPIRYENDVTCVYRLGTGVTATTERIKWIKIQESWQNILYKTFSPQYITYNDSFYPLLIDIFSVMTDKDINKENKIQLKALFKKYITPSLLMKMMPMMFRHYAWKFKGIFVKMTSHYLKAIFNRLHIVFEILRERYVRIFMTAPQVMSREDTINYILQKKCSVSRNGDGEVFLMTGKSIDFQRYDARLSKLMKKALAEQDERYLPCVINVFDKHYDRGTYYYNHLVSYRYYWYKLTNPKVIYGDAGITRFYSTKSDVTRAKETVVSLRRIWDKRNLLIVEGEQSRLGVGNDLFANAAAIRRILVPSIDAFSRYDEIKQATENNSDRDTLILLAIGPTATALAYELYKDGYWAIDIGHVDICYEWYIRGLERGDNIPGKYTNESDGEKLVGTLPESALAKFHSEIIAEIH